jgi:alkylation response protein AidB-like acyl-CoA dehydrogenase
MSIDLNLSADQREILVAVGKLLGDRFPVARLRGLQATTVDATQLSALADMGVFGLGCPESAGGTGFGIVEDCLVFVELGRHLVTPHALAATLGARVALALGQADLAGEILSGGCRVCLANFLEPWVPGQTSGVPAHLLDPADARLAVVWNDAGMALLRCDALDGAQIDGTDRSIPLQRCTVSPAAVRGWVGAEQAPLSRHAHLLVAAQLLGMAEASRDMAADYARVRVQFGQPIGAFQAVKHRCANMAIGAEALRAQLVMAAIAERDRWPDAAFQVDACRLLAPRCALANAAASIQVHGGMGFTAECDAHLYLLRAHLLEHLGGPVRDVRARLAGVESFPSS